MTAIANFLTRDHRRCDELFIQAEDAAASGDWDTCLARFGEFEAGMRRHFVMEEDVLFPAFESATGITDGPTRVMRTEHADIRQMLGEMRSAADARDADRFVGTAETLLVLMQQHNLKEENMLYRMSDRALAGSGPAVVQRMEALDGP